MLPFLSELLVVLATMLTPNCADVPPFVACTHVASSEFIGQLPGDFYYDGTNRGDDSFHEFGTHGGRFIDPDDILVIRNPDGTISVRGRQP